MDQYEKGQRPHQIDDTGEEDHDWIWVCPRGLARINSEAMETVKTFDEIHGVGGTLAYFGEGVVKLPPRVSQVFAILSGIESRMKSEVRRVRAEMDGV